MSHFVSVTTASLIHQIDGLFDNDLISINNVTTNDNDYNTNRVLTLDNVELTYKDGARYEGGLVNGKASGKGTMSYSNKDEGVTKFVTGTWKGGKLEGGGTMSISYSDGGVTNQDTFLTGTWKGGTLQDGRIEQNGTFRIYKDGKEVTDGPTSVAKNQSEDPRGVKLTSPDRSETVISNVDPPSKPSPIITQQSNVDPPSKPSPIITQQSNVDPPTPSIRSPPHLAGGSPDNTLRLGSPAVHETAQDEAAVDTAGDEVEQVNEDVLVVPVEEDEVPALEAVQPALEEAVLEEAVQPALEEAVLGEAEQPALEEAVLGEAEQPALVEAVLPLPQVHPVMMLVTAALSGLKYLVMMIATVALYLVMMIATVAFEALSVYCEALVVMQDDAEENGLPFLFGPIVENNNGD